MLKHEQIEATRALNSFMIAVRGLDLSEEKRKEISGHVRAIQEILG